VSYLYELSLHKIDGIAQIVFDRILSPATNWPHYKPLGVNLEEQELLGEKASKVVNGGAPLDYSDCRSDWDNISQSDSLKELWLVSGLWSCACPIWLLLIKIWKYSNLYIVINCPVICIKIAVDILLKQDHSFNEAPEQLADVILT